MASPCRGEKVISTGLLTGERGGSTGWMAPEGANSDGNGVQKGEKMGTKRMLLTTDYPTCRVIASPTHKRCQESPSTETWGINIGDTMVNTH